MRTRIQLTFILDEEVTPDYFAERVARICSLGALRPGEGIELPSDPSKMFRVTDQPEDTLEHLFGLGR